MWRNIALLPTKELNRVVVYAGKICRYIVQPTLPLVDFFGMWADNYIPAAKILMY